MFSVSLAVAILQAFKNPVNKNFSLEHFVLSFCESHTFLNLNNLHWQNMHLWHSAVVTWKWCGSRTVVIFFPLNLLHLWNKNSKFHRTIWDLRSWASGFFLLAFFFSSLSQIWLSEVVIVFQIWFPSEKACRMLLRPWILVMCCCLRCGR